MIASADEAPRSRSCSPRLGTWPCRRRWPSGARTLVSRSWHPWASRRCLSLRILWKELRLGDVWEGEGYGYEAAAMPGIRSSTERRRRREGGLRDLWQRLLGLRSTWEDWGLVFFSWGIGSSDGVAESGDGLWKEHWSGDVGRSTVDTHITIVANHVLLWGYWCCSESYTWHDHTISFINSLSRIYSWLYLPSEIKDIISLYVVHIGSTPLHNSTSLCIDYTT
jgi:hypothetical protein